MSLSLFAYNPPPGYICAIKLFYSILFCTSLISGQKVSLLLYTKRTIQVMCRIVEVLPLLVVFKGIHRHFKYISNWAESNNILSDLQFDFRKGLLTTDAVFVPNAIIQKFFNEKGQLFCAFVDPKRTFDCVYL